MVANRSMGATEKPLAGSLSSKQNKGKVPKKIHKAEREKLKRDQLNDLFFELSDKLDSARQNNGKACILDDATRLLRDLISQVDSLRKGHAALVNEFKYVSVEKNELKDENTILESEISRLQTELRERMQPSSACSRKNAAASPQQTNTLLSMPQTQVGPLYIIPLQQELQPYPDAGLVAESLKPPPQVMRPHARYASPSDSWPLEILSGKPKAQDEPLLSRNSRTAEDGQHHSSSISSLSNCVEGGSSVKTADPCNN